MYAPRESSSHPLSDPHLVRHVSAVRFLKFSPFLGAALLLYAGAADAAPRAIGGGTTATRSRAVGRPHDGHLEHAMRITSDRALTFKYGSPDEERWGTEELVGMVQRAASRVRRVHPGSVMSVGDLSRREGGRMRPHLSHRNGRDVDLGFYLRRGDEPARAQRFIRIRRSGTGGSYTFDDARNWALVTAMLTDERAEVEAILVAEHLERRLLAEARRQRTPGFLYERARLLMYQPRRGGKHDDHFHVRIRCPADDVPTCVDTAALSETPVRSIARRSPI